MDEISAIAARHGGLPVIEDAAQSFGATYKGRRSCNLSTVGCTSFFPSKPLGCYGDGGAMFTNDDYLAKVFREIRVHGQSRRYEHSRVGVGGRMDTLQCAVVLAKLDRFDWELEQRQRRGKTYNDMIDQLGVRRVHQRPDRISVFGQYTVFTSNRESMQARLAESGVPTAVHYPSPMNKQAPYRGFCCGECTPVADVVAQEVMSLPMSADVSEETLIKVVASLASCIATL
jgi:UDP-2-acetamido-2-deoxy-ribo-hexuluronate aminotransferase